MEDETCPACKGKACEYGCGLSESGGCDNIYSGPNSHKICKECDGVGVLPDKESYSQYD